jgi:hypothetical protein
LEEKEMFASISILYSSFIFLQVDYPLGLFYLAVIIVFLINLNFFLLMFYILLKEVSKFKRLKFLWKPVTYMGWLLRYDPNAKTEITENLLTTLHIKPPPSAAVP